MSAWSQRDFSAIPVLISAVSLTSRQTVREDCNEFKMNRKGKDIRKKKHRAAFVFVPSEGLLLAALPSYMM
jgi:hypothetical protein